MNFLNKTKLNIKFWLCFLLLILFVSVQANATTRYRDTLAEAIEACLIYGEGSGYEKYNWCNTWGEQCKYCQISENMPNTIFLRYFTTYGVSGFTWSIKWRIPATEITDIEKNNGKPKQICFGSQLGNPITVGTGNKYQEEVDISENNTNMLFARSYNNNSIENGAMGSKWTHTYNNKLVFLLEGKFIYSYSADGKRDIFFILDSNSFFSTPDVNKKLIHNYTDNILTGYSLTNEFDEVEVYDTSGKLQSITDVKGNTQTLSYNATSSLLETVTTNTGELLTFTYDISNRIKDMTDHTGRQWRYGYDTNNNLQYVSYPDGTDGMAGSNPFGEDNPYKEYHYEKASLLNALTGITDERGIRYATYEYDSTGRATASYHGSQTTTLPDRIDGVSIVYE